MAPAPGAKTMAQLKEKVRTGKAAGNGDPGEDQGRSSDNDADSLDNVELENFQRRISIVSRPLSNVSLGMFEMRAAAGPTRRNNSDASAFVVSTDFPGQTSDGHSSDMGSTSLPATPATVWNSDHSAPGDTPELDPTLTLSNHVFGRRPSHRDTDDDDFIDPRLLSRNQ